MRVTFNMMSRRVLDGISGSSQRLFEAQQRASSGKRIQKPSDDVSGTGRAMSLRSSLSEIEQYLTNCGTVHNQMNIASSAMDSVVKLVQKVRSTAVHAANATINEESKTALIAELDEITSSLVAAANTQHGGKYIFSGSLTNQQTISPSGLPAPAYAYTGNGTPVMVQTSPWTSTQVNVLGSRIFNMDSSAVSTSPDIFATIADLKAQIRAGDTEAISQQLTHIDANLNNMIVIRSEIGARIASLESINDSLLDSKLSLSSLLSKTEDADLAEVIMELGMRENMYQAAISTAKRILSMSLMDFLR